MLDVPPSAGILYCTPAAACAQSFRFVRSRVQGAPVSCVQLVRHTVPRLLHQLYSSAVQCSAGSTGVLQSPLRACTACNQLARVNSSLPAPAPALALALQDSSEKYTRFGRSRMGVYCTRTTLYNSVLYSPVLLYKCSSARSTSAHQEGQLYNAF